MPQGPQEVLYYLIWHLQTRENLVMVDLERFWRHALCLEWRRMSMTLAGCTGDIPGPEDMGGDGEIDERSLTVCDSRRAAALI